MIITNEFKNAILRGQLDLVEKVDRFYVEVDKISITLNKKGTSIRVWKGSMEVGNFVVNAKWDDTINITDLDALMRIRID